MSVNPQQMYLLTFQPLKCLTLSSINSWRTNGDKASTVTSILVTLLCNAAQMMHLCYINRRHGSELLGKKKITKNVTGFLGSDGDKHSFPFWLSCLLKPWLFKIFSIFTVSNMYDMSQLAGMRKQVRKRRITFFHVIYNLSLIWQKCTTESTVNCQ